MLVLTAPVAALAAWKFEASLFLGAPPHLVMVAVVLGWIVIAAFLHQRTTKVWHATYGVSAQSLRTDNER
jgi:hypothetical protein